MLYHLFQHDTLRKNLKRRYKLQAERVYDKKSPRSHINTRHRVFLWENIFCVSKRRGNKLRKFYLRTFFGSSDAVMFGWNFRSVYDEQLTANHPHERVVIFPKKKTLIKKFSTCNYRRWRQLRAVTTTKATTQNNASYFFCTKQIPSILKKHLSISNILRLNFFMRNDNSSFSEL